MNLNKLKNLKQIKLVLTDVDGVLTDGGMYYSSKGDMMKKFHVRDGMGVNLLKKNGIGTIIVTKEKNEIIRQWAKKMNVLKLFDGVQDKSKVLPKICKNFSILSENIAYIGDDINDLGLLKLVGFSAVPHDAIVEAKQICNYVCKQNSGNGVFREISDLILYSKKLKEKH